ncbi:MAG: hypothetical protein QM783_07205 [Phycisphaerales bacterium]
MITPSPTRFSPVIRLPSLYGNPAALAGVVPLLSIGMVAVGHSWIPTTWIAVWEWYHYAIMFAVAAGPLSLIMLFIQHLLKLGVRARMREWLAQAPRSPADHAAAAFYIDLQKTRKSQRAANTARYLDAVPADQGRLLVFGDLPLQLADDGTLSEEADVFEGRARKVPKWVYGCLAVLLVVQVSIAFLTGGLNPLYWRYATWMILLPAAMNATFILLGWGIVRLPGSVALASPRSATRSSLYGVFTFTTDDSLLVVHKINRMVVCVFYRRDGRCSGLTYPSADTKGFHALVNRWCVLPRATLVAVDASAAEPVPSITV